MSETALPTARLDLGRVLSQTFGVIGRNLGAVVLTAFLVALLSILIEFGLGYGTASLLPGVFSLRGIQVIGGVAGFTISTIALGAITRIAIADLNETPVGLGAAFATGVRLLFPLLGLTIVYGLMVAVGLVLLVVPGVWLLLRWAVAAPVRVAEGHGIRNAFERSADLTKGHRWRLFLLLVAFAVLSFGVSLAFGWVGGVFATGWGQAIRLIIVGAANVLASTITTSISSAGLAACYTELRRMADGGSSRNLAAVFE